MEKLLYKIIEMLRHGEDINEDRIQKIVRQSNVGLVNEPHHAKKQLMPFYLKIKKENPELWQSWNVDPELEQKLIKTIRVKPVRSASGVATITVITKPWPCGGNCLFCPNDIRMPKSYLSDEPACQRAERNFFDPYLQVSARLRALHEMGHNTDKVEIIVLGGTWNDYTPDYQRWYVTEIFRALNDGVFTGTGTNSKVIKREEQYSKPGILNDTSQLKANARSVQQHIDEHKLSYKQAYNKYYSGNSAWQEVATWQTATWQDVEVQHKLNEDAKHRCVGLVFETRPAVINDENLQFMRRLGCTKVQIGVQSLVEKNMKDCDRETSTGTVAKAFEQLRLFGFKIHAHFMANLPGATPESDKQDFRMLVSDEHYLPDEIKLYPCMLVESARLNLWADAGRWQAYDEQTLVDVLADDVIATPRYTRISRMMRDISSGDIKQGVKKTNLRQMVEQEADKRCDNIQEIRHREIRMSNTSTSHKLEDFTYNTSVTTEHFLQFITPENKILGFCRLSLPNNIEKCKHTAMIREVHVYGKVAKIGDEATNAQHMGLGTKLIEEACRISRDFGYKKINVISAIGTRNYYRKRGFEKFSDDGLYQQKEL